TIKLFGSVVSATGNGQVDTTGGEGGDPGSGDVGTNGRFILGRNTTDEFGGDHLVGTTPFVTTNGQGRNLGSRAENPYITPATETPLIPGLAGDVEAFGLTTLSADADFAAVSTNGAVAALHLMDTGPSGLAQNWDGFDMLLLLNLTSNGLEHAFLGAGSPGELVDLLEGGFWNDPLFVDGGEDQVIPLGAFEVYATLVPEGTTHFNIAVMDRCVSAYVETLDLDDSLYLIAKDLTSEDCNDSGVIDYCESAQWTGAGDDDLYINSNNWEADVGGPLVPTAHALLEYSTVDASLAILNDPLQELCTLIIEATAPANQTLQVGDTGQPSKLTVSDQATIKGGGILKLVQGTVDAVSSLQIETDGWLVGKGTVSGTGTLVNAGTVEGPTEAEDTLDLSVSSFENTADGVLQTPQNSDGGSIVVNCNSVTQNGKIIVDNGSTLSFSSTLVNDGQIVIESTGKLTMLNSGLENKYGDSKAEPPIKGIELKGGELNLGSSEWITNFGAQGTADTPRGYIYGHGSITKTNANSTTLINQGVGDQDRDAGLHVVGGDLSIVGGVTNWGSVVIEAGCTLYVDFMDNHGFLFGSWEPHPPPPGRGRDAGRGASGGTLDVSGKLSLDESATVIMLGGHLRVRGDVDIAINDPERWDLTDGTLQLNGVFFQGDQEVEVLAPDAGAVVHPEDPMLFPIGEVRVGPNPASVVLVNNHDNSGSRGDEMLYIGNLVVEAGSTLDLMGTTLYYQEAATDGTIADSVGGGELVAIDCNSNAVADHEDLTNCDGSEWCDDCNGNSVLDECDIIYAVSRDCNTNGIPDECEFADCNTNCVPDELDIALGTSIDCNTNGTPDECEISAGTAADCNWNSILDECEISAGTGADCNWNSVLDECDIASGTSLDCNETAVPDECELIVAGDFDADEDVDLDDYEGFLDCLAGPNALPAPATPACVGACLASSDFDADNDVDLADFAALQTAFTGSTPEPRTPNR
ncbi:MAG: hypothetical protein KAV82_15460, partial [Phycisphaerae bacterium]|nr:hypothetical protein [Phycisphaerae bacterium]